MNPKSLTEIFYRGFRLRAADKHSRVFITAKDYSNFAAANLKSSPTFDQSLIEELKVNVKKTSNPSFDNGRGIKINSKKYMPNSSLSKSNKPNEIDGIKNLENLQNLIKNEDIDGSWNCYLSLVNRQMDEESIFIPILFHLKMIQLHNLNKLKRYNLDTIEEFENRLTYISQNINAYNSYFKDVYYNENFQIKNSTSNFKNGISYSSNTNAKNSADIYNLVKSFDYNGSLDKESSISTNSNSNDFILETIILNHMLKFFLDSNQPQKAKSIWSEATQVGTFLDSYSYNLYLANLTKNISPHNFDSFSLHEAANIWHLMKKNNIPRTHYTNAAAIKVFGYLNDLKLARDIFNSTGSAMSDNDFTENPYIDSKQSLIDRMNPFGSNNSLDSHISNTQPKIDTDFFNSFKSPKAAIKTFSHDNRRSLLIYNSMIEAYCYQKDFDSAFKVFYSLCPSGHKKILFKSSIISDNFDLETSISANKASANFHQSPGSSFLSPDLSTFNILIKYLCVNNLQMEAIKLVETMVSEFNIKPSIKTLKLILTKSFAKNNYPLASKVSEWFTQSLGVTPLVPRIANILEHGYKVHQIQIQRQSEVDVSIDYTPDLNDDVQPATRVDPSINLA
ncbi:hypothetical protein AYI70_g2123 [Smittium culicis]|uniref:Pentatricopeptide repeat-containing protein n=1 Tax=Smittium culicis TaxID=133412 RepID=A0A1R1Y9Q5_9FUNG|nr:hypothetical protein AYI70_g2123 [Smittium culicis]